MALIDIGDLTLSGGASTLQQQLFHAIRAKIVKSLWPLQGKLPSTRKLASELNVSRNTVTAAYEQLLAEGYIESKQGSGFYVAVELPDKYVPATVTQGTSSVESNCFDINSSFAPGVPDLSQFPLGKWQRLLQRHVLRPVLLGNQNIQGSEALRAALSDYLSSSRSVHCSAQRIIVTSGAQQALTIAMAATLAQGEKVLMEQPGYAQMTKVLELNQYQLEPLTVHQETGFELNDVLKSTARALYITPSNQYPMGTTINTENRLKLIEWAASNQGWIIEDDYDSEFQFAHRPYTSLQGLAGQMGLDEHVIYIGSLSKVMFNGLRLGYMVVPDSLIESCLEIKDAMSGDSPSHTQEALADFIAEGHLIRHIRKMRRLYKQKHEIVSQAIVDYFHGRVEIISQAAGLHVTLKWNGGIDEQEWVARAEKQGIVLRPLSYYEHTAASHRTWRSVVLGFGNTPLSELEPRIRVLARLFES
ncbi:MULTISPECIES: MocR-like pyridoxine biosynthesis transcription factor PdxR [Vibrio]|uniref:MocR-like pyridoxine biosynthesis transcription factor PdxR n=1 Tax=Vibrio TaxID=662 RepID=UPI0020752B6F|nr:MULTISPECIES: PLP-dependent aminotransferase family protein [Vibrio]USD35167.1 PLP-dependent aminotransferase family protein [Vibrio sp. SCSIO 43186]USD48232.1 PLP-dependent aminotransferase family protein [Vibrio sp. SCSIO 43145]USD72292.1 PLP-dependent aminotransferase family protein [Vibrio sp. SCSIO 43139]USD97970.1 GntR family transcriptional regulator [Vibrio coralliilyticus]